VPSVSDEVRQLVEWKKKYWSNALSDQAVDLIFSRISDVFDLASFLGDWVMSDTLFSTLLAPVFFDISPSEVTAWLLTWEEELPSIDEYLKGMLIDLKPIDITLKFPQLSSSSWVIRGCCKCPFADNLDQSKLTPATVGQTKWGEGYIDPPAVREFLRSSMYAFFKKGGSPQAIKARMLAAAKALGISEDLVRAVYNRFAFISAVKEKAATVSYAWADKTSLSEEEGVGKVQFIDFDGNLVEAEYDTLADALWSAIVSVTSVDYSVVAPDENPIIENPPLIEQIRDFVVQNYVSRLMATPLAVANYQRAEARREWSKSPRVETYAVPTSHRLRLESLTKQVLLQLKPDATPTEIRLYQDAVLNLYSSISSPHTWGNEAVRAMTRDELKTYWVERWASAGLDRDLLSSIFDAVYPALSSFTSQRVSERVRFLRYRMRVST